MEKKRVIKEKMNGKNIHVSQPFYDKRYVGSLLKEGRHQKEAGKQPNSNNNTKKKVRVVGLFYGSTTHIQLLLNIDDTNLGHLKYIG